MMKTEYSCSREVRNFMERANLAEILKAARKKKGWSQRKAAEAVEVDENTWQRWEAGQQEPRGYNLRQVFDVFGLKMEELGLIDEIEAHVQVVSDRGDVAPEDDVLFAFRKQDLTLCLMGIVWRWPRRNTQYNELQALLTRTIEEHITLNQDHIISRRDALRRLASLPIEYYGLSAFRVTLLTHCAAGITACWYLRKGKELAFAAQSVASYVPTLKAIAESSTLEHRKAAADLLAQCSLLQSLLANRFSDSTASLNHAKQAEKYSEAAENIVLQILAVRAQASAHDFAQRWEQALTTAKRAKLLLEANKGTSIPPLVASQVYASLGNYQGHTGQKQDVLYSLGLARARFFAHPSDEPAPAWVPVDQGVLLLNDGLARFHLGLYKDARDSFEQVVATSATSVTARVEALVNQVMAEVSRDDQPRDMDYCITHWKQGIQGATSLQSEELFDEAVTAFTAMRAAWPAESRIKELRELIVHW
jgi:transcriptional regulator with XRE-family HTH domain/tetratricopeptide (TPR) repeat protein